MRRVVLIVIGTVAVFHVDLASEDFWQSRIFPLINAIYLVFLFKVFVEFLAALQKSAIKTKDVNIVDFLYDVYSTIILDLEGKYQGEFNFMGKYSILILDLVIYGELICMSISFFKELNSLAILVS